MWKNHTSTTLRPSVHPAGEGAANPNMVLKLQRREIREGGCACVQLFCGRGLQKLTVSKFGVRANALIRLLFSLYKARIHILEARIFSPAWAPGGLLTKVPTKSGYEVTGAARFHGYRLLL